MRLSSPSHRRRTSPNETLITAAVLATLAASAPAQRQFDELRGRGLPADPDGTQAVALGDVDGDGDLDLICGDAGYIGGQNRLYLNDGDGAYTDATAGRIPTGFYSTQAVALGDVDGDGDLDLVCGNQGFFPGPWVQNRLYLNDGTGTFTDATAARLPVDNDSTHAVALADVDGDGDLDLFFGNAGYPGQLQNRLHLNDGTGFFTDATAARMPADNDRTSALVPADVDGDGDLDLVVGNGVFAGEQNRLYLNDGTGIYTDATAARMPADGDVTQAVALGDADGDGDLDMVCGNAAYSGEQNRLYLNDGAGTYTDATAARMPADGDSTQAVVLGDVDGDGDLDVICGNGFPGYFGQQNRLYLNDGSGVFTDSTAARLPSDINATQAVLGDVDGDGDLDVVCGNGGYDYFAFEGQNRLYLNDSTGVFTDATASRIPFDADYGTAVVLEDLDGDGDLDMVCGNNGSQNRLYLNDGAASFTDATAARMPVDGDFTWSIVSGDVDGDGDLDLVFGNVTVQNRLYLNDGMGTFTDATAGRMPVDVARTFAVALGDVDGDGDLDLICGNGDYYRRQQNRLYLNDGTGTFTDATAARLPTLAGGSLSVACADLDADGDLDLVFGNHRLQDRLYLNDGTGTFADVTAGHMPVDNSYTSGVEPGDVDGDGDLDLVLGDATFNNRLYLNDGTGTFTDATSARLPTAFVETRAVALGDVDGDSDLDIVFGNEGVGVSHYYGWRNLLYLNDGTGTFTDASAARMPDLDNATLAVTLGDVDGDGDLDLACANGVFGGRQNRLYLNLGRQLDAPFLLRRGRTYTLDAYARHGPPSDVDVAAPFLSLGTASIPLPWGTLGLDPGQMVALPPFLIPRQAGVGSVSFTVPGAHGNVGVAVHAQALLLQQPFTIRLTNVTGDTILR